MRVDNHLVSVDGGSSSEWSLMSKNCAVNLCSSMTKSRNAYFDREETEIGSLVPDEAAKLGASAAADQELHPVRAQMFQVMIVAANVRIHVSGFQNRKKLRSQLADSSLIQVHAGSVDRMMPVDDPPLDIGIAGGGGQRRLGSKQAARRTILRCQSR